MVFISLDKIIELDIAAYAKYIYPVLVLLFVAEFLSAWHLYNVKRVSILFYPLALYQQSLPVSLKLLRFELLWFSLIISEISELNI